MLQVLLQYNKAAIIEEVTVVTGSLTAGTQFFKIEMDFYMSSPGMKFSHLGIVLIFRIS